VPSNADSRFVELIRSWLVSLPHDLKIAYEAMDDENLPRAARELAVGAIIYVVSPNDIVTDRNDSVASYVDDALLLRLALRKVLTKGEADGEAANTFRSRFPEVFETMEKDLELCNGQLGDLIGWLDKKVDGLVAQEHKGKKAPAFLEDDEAREELFEDGLVFRTDYPIDEETIGDKLKKASTVTDVMKRRRAEEMRQGA
jgi:uncharacterized membrane protein YkvA (DUF1232 family)